MEYCHDSYIPEFDYFSSLLPDISLSWSLYTWNFNQYSLITKTRVFTFQKRNRPQISSRPTYCELYY